MTVAVLWSALNGCQSPGSHAADERADSQLTASASSPASPASTVQEGGGGSRPPAVRISRSELASLRWIVGSWRGTGGTEAPFYERYQFVNDTTLSVETFPDSVAAITAAGGRETTFYVLHDGRLANTGGGAIWEATSFSRRAVTFSPVRIATNTFEWRSDTEDAWTATLVYPPSARRPSERRVVYHLTRLRTARDR